jgi:hypothetical protein
MTDQRLTPIAQRSCVRRIQTSGSFAHKDDATVAAMAQTQSRGATMDPALAIWWPPRLSKLLLCPTSAHLSAERPGDERPRFSAVRSNRVADGLCTCAFLVEYLFERSIPCTLCSREELSSGGRDVTSFYGSRRTDYGVHASAGEFTEIADLHSIMLNERAKNIAILG